MNYRTLLAACALLISLGVTAVAQATVEGALAPSRLEFESAGIGTSGPVRIEASASLKGLESLRVHAFGKTVELAPEHLALLSGHVVNSVSVSYAHAPPADGGRIIFVILGKVFGSGLVDAMIVSIDESGHVHIHALEPQ